MFHGIHSFGSTARRGNWFVLLAVMLGAALMLAGLPGPSAALAQDAAAEGEPVEAQPSAQDDSPASAGQQPESFLTVMVRANGWFFGPVLLIMSFIMVALIVMNTLQIRRDVLLPPDFVDAFEQKLAAKDYQGAYETARNDESFLARVLAAGLGRLNRGYEEAIEGMQEVGEDENMQLEHRLSYLALIAALGPMVGLAGTVWGMIGAFESIATSAQQPKPKELAGDIYTALFTTIEGLAIAIPAMTAHSLLRNRVARYVLEIGMVSEGLMSRFSSLGKKPAAGAAPAAAPAARQE